MALNKAIKYGKEYRRPYRGGKAICKSCRNHGGCPACYANRFHKVKIKEQKMIREMKDWGF